MKLFTPETIGGVTIKNRIVMAPISTNLPSANGEVTQEMISFYEERAKGGVGLIILESSNIDYPLGKCGYTELRIDNDQFMPGLSELADRIHRAGSKVAIQLNHTGGMFGDRSRSDLMPIAPSPLVYGKNRRLAQEASLEQITSIREKFALAAERAKMAGFDAVEVHGAHGYFLAEFLSPWTNKRDDCYGGSLENRARLACEIVEEIRKKVGPSFPIIFRISGDEFVEGGRKLEETIELINIIKAFGVDCFHISAGTHRIPQLPARRAQVESMAYEQGWKSYLSGEIKGACNVKTIAVGVVRDVEVAERIVEKDADFVAMARGLVAEPHWVNKVIRGEPIRRCINCNACIMHRSYYGRKVRCTVNPIAGREYYQLPPECNPVQKQKHIAVIGGGPGGMEAAYTAAIRGHDVTLFEKSDRLGGNLYPAGNTDLKYKIHWFTEWLENQLRTLNVKIVLSSNFSMKEISVQGFDEYIVAVGSTYSITPMLAEYIEREKPSNVIQAVDMLKDKSIPDCKSHPRALVLGGGLIGCESAYFLTQKGYQVKIVTRRAKSRLISNMNPINEIELLSKLGQRKVVILDNAQCIGIDEDSLKFLRKEEEINVGYDLLILAQGQKPFTEPAEQLKQYTDKVYSIGDCVEVRDILTAVHEGYTIANML